MDSQSAYVHACKIQGSDSQCSNFGQHVNGGLLSRLAGLRREIASYPGSMSLENRPTRRTRSTASMISLESSTHTLSLYNRSIQPDRQERRRRQWLGSLETTARRVRPTSSMRRVAVLQQVQNPPRCQRVEDLGSALEDWLSLKTSIRDVH